MRNRYQKEQDLLTAKKWLDSYLLTRKNPISSRLLHTTHLTDLIFSSFDREQPVRRFEQTESLPNMESLAKDVFTALYSPVLRRKEEHSLKLRERLLNRPLLERIIQNDRFDVLKALCEDKELPSFDAVSAFCEAFAENLPAEAVPEQHWLKVIEQLQKQVEQTIQAICEMQNSARPASPKRLLFLYNRVDRKLSQIDNLMKKAQKEAVRYTESLTQTIDAAMQSAYEQAVQTHAIMQAWGDGSGEMKNTPANRELLNYVRNSEMIQKIAAYLGRYREILAAKRQNSFAYGRGEKYDIGFGSDIHSCLASELALLGTPETEFLFMRRFQQKKLMQYRKREALIKGEGDMIVLLDESSSTRLMAGWAKAITLALLDVAARGRRKFALVHFSTTTKTDLFEPGRYQTADILRAAEHFFNGGTNFERPLKEAIRLLQNGFENADITIITDGESELTDEFTKEFRETLRRQRAAMTGILLDKNNACGKTLEPFCDRIFRTKELTEDEIAVQLLDRKTS